MSDQPISPPYGDSAGDGIAGISDGTLDYSPGLDYTAGPGDPNYVTVVNYTPGPGDPNYAAGLNYTPGPGDPNYVSSLDQLNFTPGPLTIPPPAAGPPLSPTPAPNQTRNPDVYEGPGAYPPSPLESGFRVAPPPAPPTAPSFTAPPEVNSFTGRPEADPYTRQQVPDSSDVSGTPTAYPGRAGNGQTASAPYGIPDAGVRPPAPADAGTWYTPQQLQLFQQRNQQLSGQINLQLTYLDYLKATYSYGSVVPSFGDFITQIASQRVPFVSATDPAFISGLPPGGTISTLPNNYVSGTSLSDRPIWAGLENTMFSDAQNEMLYATLRDPRSYLTVLPVEAILAEVFGAEIFAGALAARGSSGTLQPAIIDSTVLVDAIKEDARALAAIRAVDPRVTFTQLGEFLNVLTEVQQTQRAQILLDEGIQLMNPQLTTPELRATFLDVAKVRGEGDAALVSFGVETGMPIVTGDRKLISTVFTSMENPPDVTFIWPLK
jgi:hypothetical protein